VHAVRFQQTPNSKWVPLLYWVH